MKIKAKTYKTLIFKADNKLIKQIKEKNKGKNVKMQYLISFYYYLKKKSNYSLKDVIS